MDEGVERATTIIKDLRTFSRLDSGRPSEIDVAQSIDATLNLLGSRLGAIEVVRDYGDVPPLRGVYAGPFKSNLHVKVTITREV
jgi:signal transduction histidine kinase